jgi:hypothetical protein
MFVRLENSRSGGVSTIDHYKGEIFRLNSECEKLREDLDALEQYGRRELMRINGIPDGGQQETTANTTKLVTDLVKSIDPDPVCDAITNFCEILVYAN